MDELNWMRHEVGDDDDCKDHTYNTEMPKKNKRTFNQTTKKSKYISSEIDRIMGRIKPSVETRDECSLARHARCFKEISSDSAEWLALHKADTLPVYPTKKKKVKKKLRKHKGKKLSSHGDEMTSENGKIFMADDDDESEYNEICSFDSKVDLSGIVLTAIDKKIIKKNRQKYHQSGDKRKQK